MTFVTTGLAIAGLCAVAIPIIIHLLFRRRRKPIEWAAMRFLIEAFRRQKRRLQLEQILLLAVRCLIVALLGAALAQPLLQHAGIFAGGNRTVYLVIDNGLAASVRDKQDRTALQRHLDEAIAIVKALNNQGDSVGIITAAQPARALVVPPSSDLGAIARLLESLQPAETPTDFPGALAQLRAATDLRDRGEGQAIAYLFSDFRTGSARLEAPLAEDMLASGGLKLLASAAATAPVENVQVIAIDPVRSVIVSGADEGATQVTVRLARNGGELGRAVSRVRLGGEGLPTVEPRVVNWEPGQSRADVDFMVDMTAAGKGSSADHSATLTASVDDDALRADDRRFDVLQRREAVQVALIDRRSFGASASLDQLSAGNWIARALAPAERGPIQVVEVDPAGLDQADLRAVDAAVLPRPDLLNDVGWSALREFVRGGGVAIVMPPSEVNVHQWTDRLVRELALPWRINLEPTTSDAGMALEAEQPASELLRLVSNDLRELVQPIVVRKWLSVDSAATSANRALLLADGSPLLISSAPQNPREGAPPGPGGSSGGSNGAAPASSGLVVYLAVAPDLSWTNLPSQPLMVPLMHEVIRQGLTAARSSRQVLVGDRPALVTMGFGRAAAAVRDSEGGEIKLDPDGRPDQPLGHSGLLAVLDPAGQKIGALAVNVLPDAARTDVQPQAAVTNWLGRSGVWEILAPAPGGAAAAVAAAADSSGPLAGYLLLAVLVLLILETALARWFSHATPTAPRQSVVAALRATIAQPQNTAQGL